MALPKAIKFSDLIVLLGFDVELRVCVIGSMRITASVIVMFLTSLLLQPSIADDRPSDLRYGDGTLRRIAVPILMYHYVSEISPGADDIRIGLTVEPGIFRQHLQYLNAEGYTTISISDLDAALMRGAPLPTKPIVLTFDDGHVDHYEHVFPALMEHGYTGTFFVITENADNNAPGYLTWQQITDMADGGMSMESHSKRHMDLRNRDYDFLVYEVLGSMESIRAHTNHQPEIFAYPAGRYDDSTLNILTTSPILRAVTTQTGTIHTTDNYLELPRLRVLGNMSVGGLRSILATGGR